METIQVVLEKELLQAADRAARRLKLNRSALVRQALRAHLEAMRQARLEQADREGYERTPERTADMSAWARVAAWPEG